MGNNSSSIWSSLNILKKGNKSKGSKRKKSKRTSVNSQHPPVAHTYDTVADYPVYAVVDKSKKNPPPANDNVQYAVIEVLKKQRKSGRNQGPNPETTEYATLNFPAYNPAKGTLV